jgi:hypothetical protein
LTVDEVKMIRVQQIPLTINEIRPLCSLDGGTRYSQVFFIGELYWLPEAMLSGDTDATRNYYLAIFIDAVFYLDNAVLHLIEPSFLILSRQHMVKYLLLETKVVRLELTQT